MIRIAFFGTPAFAAKGLESLLSMEDVQVSVVVTQPDKPAGRGHTFQHSPVKELALKAKCPILQPTRIKKTEEEFINQLSKFGPFDLGIVIAFGQILPKSVLSLPRCGCLNVHASLLPRWRGAAPIHRAIMAGDRETGIALMKMDEGLDTGDVYCTEKLLIPADVTTGIVHDQLAELGASMLKRYLADIVGGAILPVPQQTGGVTYAEKIKNEETIISWSKSAQEIWNHIRALSPVPGATTFLNGKRLKIFKANPVVPSKDSLTQVGGVSFNDGEQLHIRCGVDSLSLEEVQLEGRKKIPIGEFLRGNTIDSSTILTGNPK